MIDRRKFLQTAITAGAAYGFTGLINRADRYSRLGSAAFAGDASAYGPLVPTASVNTGETLLALPAGFQYTVISKAGSLMTNGTPTPKLHDGMAAFSSFSLPNSWIVIRNHEIQDLAGTAGTVSGTTPYDTLAGGGTTTMYVDRQTRLLTNSFTSLSGTVRNCAGGPTPWRTWISCEETTLGTSAGYAKPHGYCFEVDPRVPSTPAALTQMGRFRHEAVSVDLRSGIVYLTEDNTPQAGFYRFLPRARGDLAQGGKLQMLAVTGQPNADLRTGQTVGVKRVVEWVDIADPDPVAADSNAAAVFGQGAALGGATFARLEGCFAGVGPVFFTATNGGNAGFGQVWRYEPRPKSRFGYLTLIFESPNANVLDFPDNICFGLRGDLLICEDGTGGNFIRLIAVDGSISNFANNLVPGFETYEFTGCTFSPDRSTLFVNIQTPGLTFAIWGNW